MVMTDRLNNHKLRQLKLRRLDPSSLIKQETPVNFSMEIKRNFTMILRRRGKPVAQNLNSTSSSTEYEAIRKKNLSFFPVDSGNDAETSDPATSNKDDTHQAKVKEQQQRQNGFVEDQIFSISTSGILVVSIMLIGMSGFCVSAEYSSLNTDRDVTYFPTTGRPGEASNGLNRAHGSRETLARQQSIDRFDSGGQIRPPLIKQPTTLRPMSPKLNKGFNLQAEASQDSYLAPEERDQWLKSQESHYQGVNFDQPQQQFGLNSPPSESESAISGDPRLIDKPQERATNQENSDPEESDYEDEGGSDKANLVPERRRMLGIDQQSAYKQGMNGYQQQPLSSSAQNTESEEQPTNPIDDYDGAVTDNDAHFTRKLNGHSKNHLKQAASYNRQLDNHPLGQEERYDGSPTYPERTGNGHRSNENVAISPGSDESGYGPSPNEAYLADRAENEATGADPEDEENPNNSAPSGGQSSLISDNSEPIENRFDKRAMNSEHGSQEKDDMQYAMPVDGLALPFQSDQAAENKQPDSDQGEIGDETSGSAYAPSSIREVSSEQKRNWSGNVFKPRLGAANVVTKSPSSTLSQYIDVKPVQNRSWVPSSKQTSTVQSHTKITSRSQQSPAQVQPGTTHEPYDPQNNPSHAGKYFIN